MLLPLSIIFHMFIKAFISFYYEKLLLSMHIRLKNGRFRENLVNDIAFCLTLRSINDDDVFADFADGVPWQLEIVFTAEEAHFPVIIRYKDRLDKALIFIKKKLGIGKLAVTAAVCQVDNFLVAQITESHSFHPL